MDRRSLLKSSVALAAQSALSPALPLWAAAPGAQAPKAVRRVRPADPGWPKADSWRKLNDAVGGNLIPVHPLFTPCAAGEKSAACQETLGNIRNPFYVGDQPAGTQVSGWLDAWAPVPSVY